MTAVERNLDTIKHRDWNVVRNEWLNHVPTIQPVASPPPSNINSITELDAAVADVLLKKTVRFSDGDTVLRRTVLWEGIHLLHKASHIISAGEIHACAGICTWSLSSFYQGSLVAIKGILYLMGVALPEYSGRTVIMDLWPEDSAYQKRVRKKGFVPPTEAELSPLGCRLDHHATWYAFLRVLRTSDVSVWPQEYVDALRLLDVGRISDQRNAIHYRHGYWTFNDIYNPTSQLEWFNLPRNGKYLELDVDRNDFSLVLAFIVLNLGARLLEDLQLHTSLLEDEWKIFSTSLNGYSHLLYERAHRIASTNP